MTAAEGAFYMGTPNLFMVMLLNVPDPPWDPYALALRPLKHVVWSIALGHGLSYPNQVFPLVGRVPNLTGLIMDDFFTPKPDGQIAALTDEELRSVRSRLQLPGRKLDLWGVVYEQDLDKPIAGMLQQMDALVFGIWNAPNLPRIETHLAKLEKIAPQKRTVMLCYLWDYAARRPMPLELLQAQCETGLRWLQEGRIDGVAFWATCICDLGLETVEWTRNWIARVGDQPVPANPLR